MDLRALEEEVKFKERLDASLEAIKAKFGDNHLRKMREYIRQTWDTYVVKYENVPLTDDIVKEIEEDLLSTLREFKGIDIQLKVVIEKNQFYIEPKNYETWSLIDSIYKEIRNHERVQDIKSE